MPESANDREESIKHEIGRLQAELETIQRQLAEARKRLPEEPVADYQFQLPRGEAVLLSALFGDSEELIVVHNMGRRCPYCTLWADGLNGVLPHLENRAAFVVVSPDAPEVQSEFANSRGWRFRMVSSQGSTFTADMGFLVDGSDWPGFSTFRKGSDGKIYRAGKDFFGPGDPYCAVWHMFTLLPRGVNNWEPDFSYGD